MSQSYSTLLASFAVAAGAVSLSACNDMSDTTANNAEPVKEEMAAAENDAMQEMDSMKEMDAKKEMGDMAKLDAMKEQMTTDPDNRHKAVAVISSIETGDPTAISYINPTKYIQHNLAVGDGLEGFGAVMQALPEGSAKADVKRAFQDGDYVFLHTEYNFFGPKVGFDVFRFEDGLIVEHWDNLAELATEPNPSGRTQLDGATEITDLDKTEENKALVASFVDTILIKGDMSQINTFIDNEDSAYLQHNTMVADGLSGLGAALEALAEAGTPMVYTQNHMILGEGNFVLSISEGTFMGEHVSFYDLFRIENGKIIEHWDTIETIPPESEWKNSNGKFGF